MLAFLILQYIAKEGKRSNKRKNRLYGNTGGVRLLMFGGKLRTYSKGDSAITCLINNAANSAPLALPDKRGRSPSKENSSSWPQTFYADRASFITAKLSGCLIPKSSEVIARISTFPAAYEEP